MTSKATTPQALYQRAAQDAAHTVIRQYSTSFGVATAMLTEPVRTHVRNIYALVRVADEIVDGSFDPAPIPHLTAALDALEAEVAQAMDRGFSTNLIVHAFAHTAVTCGITDAEIVPFFASMRRDLGDPYYTAEELSTYIYGSAEVIGMMCLRAFAQAPDVAPTQRSTLVADNIDAARALGAAFQKINFLRDLAADQGELGRYYFPDVAAKGLTEPVKNEILADIEHDLDVARQGIARLPSSSRGAVKAAYLLFTSLTRKLRRASCEELRTRRLRLTTPHKAVVLARSALPTTPRPRIQHSAGWTDSKALTHP